MTQNSACTHVPETFMESYCRFLETVSFLCVLDFFPAQSPCLHRSSSLFTRGGLRMLDVEFPMCYWSGFAFQNKNKNKAQFKYRFHFHPNHQSLQRVRWKVQVWLNHSVNQNSVYGPYIAWLIPVHTGQTNQIKCNILPCRGSLTSLEVIWFSMWQITVISDS